jgi:hypothetical protein
VQKARGIEELYFTSFVDSPPQHDQEHTEYAKADNRKALSMRWFHRFKARFPQYLSRHACESYAVGRAQVTRAMIDTIYDTLQTVLDEVVDPILPSNIWNFDETAHKIKYCKAFLYGLRGATKNNAESNGLLN